MLYPLFWRSLSWASFCSWTVRRTGCTRTIWEEFREQRVFRSPHGLYDTQISNWNRSSRPSHQCSGPTMKRKMQCRRIFPDTRGSFVRNMSLLRCVWPQQGGCGSLTRRGWMWKPVASSEWPRDVQSLPGWSPSAGNEMIWVHRTVASRKHWQPPQSQGRLLCWHVDVSRGNAHFNPPGSLVSEDRQTVHPALSACVLLPAVLRRRKELRDTIMQQA